MTSGSYGEGVMTSGSYEEDVMTSCSYGESATTSSSYGEGVMIHTVVFCTEKIPLIFIDKT